MASVLESEFTTAEDKVERNELTDGFHLVVDALRQPRHC